MYLARQVGATCCKQVKIRCNDWHKHSDISVKFKPGKTTTNETNFTDVIVLPRRTMFTTRWLDGDGREPIIVWLTHVIRKITRRRLTAAAGVRQNLCLWRPTVLVRSRDLIERRLREVVRGNIGGIRTTQWLREHTLTARVKHTDAHGSSLRTNRLELIQIWEHKRFHKNAHA